MDDKAEAEIKTALAKHYQFVSTLGPGNGNLVPAEALFAKCHLSTEKTVCLTVSKT